MVIGTPTPADVATALWIGFPYRVRMRLDVEPPLTPISDEARPTRKPYNVITRPCGKSSPSRQCSRANRSFDAMNAAINTKAHLKTAPGNSVAASAPTATPQTAGTAQRRTTPPSTAPCARCARYDQYV